jgi:molybdopterin biosynthesis enzyme
MTRDAPIVTATALPRLRADLLTLAEPVLPRSSAIEAAIGAVVAADVVAAAAVPEAATARIAGFAVASVETVGASPYAPACPSRLVAIAAGAMLPPGCDAVVPADAVTRDLGLEAVQQAVAPGENVRRVGEDLAAGTRSATAGRRLEARAALVAAAIGVREVSIRRPRVVVHPGGAPAALAARLVAAMLAGDGVEVVCRDLDDPATDGDLTLFLGDVEIGPGDAALAALDRRGRRLGHGAAIGSVESLAWGAVGERPALVLPHRPEAIVAAKLTLIDPLIAALAGAAGPPASETRPLARKLVSQVGMSEIALVAADGATWRPLATGDLTWGALVAADAFVELPPESEGLAEGTSLAAHPLTFPSLRRSS